MKRNRLAVVVGMWNHWNVKSIYGNEASEDIADLCLTGYTKGPGISPANCYCCIGCNVHRHSCTRRARVGACSCSTVGIPAVESSSLDSPDLDEERRVCYVAWSRAQDLLYLSYVNLGEEGAAGGNKTLWSPYLHHLTILTLLRLGLGLSLPALQIQ